MEKLMNPGIWKGDSLFYTRGTMGVVLGPMFFGWIPLLIAGYGLEKQGFDFFTVWSKPLVFVTISWFICAYLVTLKRFLRLEFRQRALVTGTRHFFWWVGRKTLISPKATIQFDLHEGTMVKALSGGTGQDWSGTTLYCRLQLMDDGKSTTLWEQPCSPSVASVHFVTAEYRKLGRTIAEKLDLRFDDQGQDDVFVKELGCTDVWEGEPITCQTERQSTAVGFLVLFALAFTWGGLQVGFEEAIAPGILFGGVGVAFWYGVVYLLFRKVAVHTDPGTGHIVLQRGWFGQQTKDFLTVGSEARVIVHPTNGDTPRKSQLGHDRVHALAFHAILFVDGTFIALPRDNHYHFADVLHFAKGFSHASGIPVQLLGRGALQAHQRLLEHPPLQN